LLGEAPVFGAVRFKDFEIAIDKISRFRSTVSSFPSVFTSTGTIILAGTVTRAVVHVSAFGGGGRTVTISGVALQCLVLNEIIEEVPGGPVIVLFAVWYKVTGLRHSQPAKVGRRSPVATDRSSWAGIPVDLARLTPEFSRSFKLHTSKPGLYSFGTVL